MKKWIMGVYVVASLCLFLTAQPVKAHNETSQCTTTMAALPNGSKLVDLDKEQWNRRYLKNHDYCLVSWSTWDSGYPPSLLRQHGCEFEGNATIKFMADATHEQRRFRSGFSYRYFWNCKKIK